MPCQLIPQLGFHKCQSGKYPFIFYTTNDLDNDQFNKFHEFKDMNNQQIVYDKLAPQFSDWVFISKLFHALTNLCLHSHVENASLQIQGLT
jgi:isochorismate hydrolase